MVTTLRIFPLDSVLFPGMRLPVHVVEPRLSAVIEGLAGSDPLPQRLLGVVAIREGYQVGRRHGRQSAHRVGCEALVAEATSRSDGSWDVELVGQRRIRVERLVSERRDEPLAAVAYPAEVDGPRAVEAATAARTAFEAYRHLVATHGGADLAGADLPAEPLPLSYALATVATLPLRERQLLLEAADAADRLQRLTLMLRAELAAMQAVASLPATRLARTGWSPN
ncbi:MAG TPA: LON peptidase substrate-binding domain-containing protein [Nocardioidaceae bacterium]|nr:LON peptidase substrate-binding domain-containing protein [Nocardioidaceae bacterium]